MYVRTCIHILGYIAFLKSNEGVTMDTHRVNVYFVVDFAAGELRLKLN